MFEKLRGTIDTHFASSPHKLAREEFLSSTADTPLERKAHFTPEVVGAAAAYEALKAFEHEDIHKGDKPTHARAKEIIVGIAEGFAVRLIEERRLPFSSEAEGFRFKAEAQAAARRDAKRALRESGYFTKDELDPIEEDEKHGHKV